MNVIIPVKRRDGGSSFLKLVTYISAREDKPTDDDVITDKPKRPASQTKKAVFDRLVEYMDRSDESDASLSSVEYLPDGRQRLKVGEVSCETDCFSWETAAAEMNMVASQNIRCIDPVYHFILSWRENDLPTDAQIFESAQHCIRVLGMEGHQYVTAIHQDTDNTHCHIAINRVSPVDYKAANMWNDADKLQKACRVLERKYGFEQDNGSWAWGVNNQLVRAQAGFKHAPQGTVQREVYSDKESLFHYAVRRVREEVDQAIGEGTASWDNLHSIMNAKGLSFREQSGGLVVFDTFRPESAGVKASSIHPSMTMAQLEPHYGAFEQSAGIMNAYGVDDQHRVLERYQPLFQVRDRDARAERREERADAREALKARYQTYKKGWIKPDLHVTERQQAIAMRYRSMKLHVRRNYNDPLLRKLMYRVAEFERMKAMAELRLKLREERQALTDQGAARPLSYRLWVEQEALRGDTAAVSQMRGFAYREKRKERVAKAHTDGVIVCAQADDSPVYDRPFHASQLRRDGTIEYLRYGQVGVVDRGYQVEIRSGFDENDEAANLRLATGIVSTKSGDRVEVVGTDYFVDQVLMTAGEFNQRFSDSSFGVTDREQQARYDYLESYYRQEPQGIGQQHRNDPRDVDQDNHDPKTDWSPNM